jgi:hypothetical protein
MFRHDQVCRRLHHCVKAQKKKKRKQERASSLHYTVGLVSYGTLLLLILTHSPPIRFSIEYNVELHKRFGDNAVTIPVVLCGDASWIVPANSKKEDNQVLQDSLLRFCIDSILSGNTNTIINNKSSSSSDITHKSSSSTANNVPAHTPASGDITFVPPKIGTKKKKEQGGSVVVESKLQEQLGNLPGSASPRQKGKRGSIATMTTTTSGSNNNSHTKPLFRDVRLPDGSTTTVADLTRLLCKYADHRFYQKNGRTYYYMRGFEVLQLLANLFFEDIENQEELHDFGRQLVQEHLILHNYTPDCDDFNNTFLVLQPFRAPRILNTFVQWPDPSSSHQHHHSSSCQDADDPMDVILRLSRQMDLICCGVGGAAENSNNHTGKATATTKPADRGNCPEFQALQVAVCQLQHVGFPVLPVEKVTFALNLFNLMVRHAMLLSAQRGWTWPTTLVERRPFFQQIGYNVAGEWVNLAALQASLYGCSISATANTHGSSRGEGADLNYSEPRLAQQRSWSPSGLFRRLLFPSKGGGILPAAEKRNEYYKSRAIRTDPRILLATTWGCQSSPAAMTAYPNRLQECLQTAAEVYCQTNVRIFQGNKVVLPTLLSWHRKDFGGVRPSQVLTDIFPYLSSRQLRQIEAARMGGRLQIVFADNNDFDWTCGLPPNPVDEMGESSSQLMGNNVRQKKRRTQYHQDLLPTDHRWAGNQPSVGHDIQLAPPRRWGEYRGLGPLPQQEETERDGRLDDGDGNDSEYQQSCISAMTMGSEFGLVTRQRLYL